MKINSIHRTTSIGRTCLLYYLMLLLSYPCFAQTSRAITTYQYRQVPENKIAEFIRRETTYFSEVAKKATEKGNLQFWALLQKVGGQDGGNSPNFLFINTYNDIDAVGEVWGSAAALFPKVPAAQMETNSMSKVIGTYFLSAQAWEQSAKAEPKDYKFIKFNYMTSSNPAGSIGLEKKHWQPFIKKVMDNGQTPQVAWGNAILLSPVGEDVKFNLVAYDIFPNLKEALNPNWDEKTEFPVDGLTEIGKLEVKPRSGEVYQIIKTVSAAPMAAN